MNMMGLCKKKILVPRMESRKENGILVTLRQKSIKRRGNEVIVSELVKLRILVVY